MMSIASKLYPFETSWVDVFGHRMHVVDVGPKDAEAVVMVHGNPTWSFFYRNLIQRLRPNYRCIAPDHIGCGYSDKPSPAEYPYQLRRRVQDLEEALRRCGVEKFHLVAHDWGGMIGTAFATRHPDRILSLTLMNTAAFRLPEDNAFPWMLGLARTPVIGSLLVRGFNAFALGAAYTCTQKPLPPEIESEYLAPYGSWKERAAVHAFVKDIPLTPNDLSYGDLAQTEAKLGALANKPMLLLWGMKDFIFDAHFLNRWLDFFPNAEVQRYADAGHYVLEDATDKALPRIEKFLGALRTRASTAAIEQGL